MGLLALFRRKPLERPGFLLYTAAVAAARDPWFFGPAVGVPDTLDGRFDLVGLHAGLVIRRLHRDPDPRGAEAGNERVGEPLRGGLAVLAAVGNEDLCHGGVDGCFSACCAKPEPVAAIRVRGRARRAHRAAGTRPAR